MCAYFPFLGAVSCRRCWLLGIISGCEGRGNFETFDNGARETAELAAHLLRTVAAADHEARDAI